MSAQAGRIAKLKARTVIPVLSDILYSRLRLADPNRPELVYDLTWHAQSFESGCLRMVNTISEHWIPLPEVVRYLRQGYLTIDEKETI